RLAHVHLTERRRVDPELLAVGDDLLGRRLLVLPAELAALLQIDHALGGDGLVQALVEGVLRELGAEIRHAAVGRLDVAHEVVQALQAGAAPATLEQDWRPEAWLADLPATREAATAALDRVRDEWIAADERGWLESHRFYPGVVERLRGLVAGPVAVHVITTKEGRFARQLLRRQGVELPAGRVLGKEARRPKRATLRELVAGGDAARMWFVEDRLAT